MTRILIADDHAVVRSGVRSIIESHAGWTVVAEAADGKDAIDKAIATQPDVAILDDTLPRINGIEATRQIRLRAPNVEVLILTEHDNEIIMRDAFSAGARGYLLKTEAEQELVAAIETLALHRPYLTGQAMEALLAVFLTDARPTKQLLTARERSVVQLVAEGHSNKRIAEVLSVSVKTVETHRAAIMRKLELTSAAALVRYAVRHKLIEP
jgi:DNA-binding NarL/FixJ family response regulator